ncbi:MAG: hypothetical protein IMY72_14100 [Bacteroidetes bacterium]|nr:hypothetical protein [Bacteroidota bacterium]
MNRKVLIFVLLVFAGLNISAQNYGNEWINYSQNYYKIPISKTGIYSISETELENFGIPTGSFNPQNVQIFHNGQEIPLYIDGESLGLTTYIEFYAEKNGGGLDTALFDSLQSQTNPYYSLINDTSAYFLTWNNSFSNLRYENESDTNFDDYGLSPYCKKTVLSQYTSKYYYGKTDCEYTKAEGWFDNTAISLGNTIKKTIETPNSYSSNTNATIKFALATFSSYQHHINVENVGFSFDTTFSGLTHIIKSFSFSSSLIENTSTIYFKSINDLDQRTDYSTVSYIEITYPHTYDFEDKNNFNFTVPHNSNNKTLIKITNFDIDNSNIILYDITNNKRIAAVTDNDTIKAIINKSLVDVNCVITNQNAINKVRTISKVVFVDYSKNQSDYVIISHKNLFDISEDYKNYRNAKLVFIDDLYNQFAYGINKHPIAIKNFANYIINTWGSIPKNLLLLGKSISAQYYRKDSRNYLNTLVPSFGEPTSDMLLTAGLNGTNFEPAIPTGRISAKNPEQVELYLDKVIEYENSEPELWMKNILHFGGGKSSSEQSIFATYLNNYENIIEDTSFGGSVSTFLKNSSDPIQITQTDSIKNLINGGCSLLTFFGHAAASGFDQNIDEPSAYKNKGKYPFLFANSCYSGNIHLPNTQSTSEKWVLIKEKGVIGFIAVVFEGYTSYLNKYSLEFYKNLSFQNYGGSIGESMKMTSQKIEKGNLENSRIKSTCLEMTLHGDPALKFFSPDLPDLSVSQSSIKFSPSHISSQIDSFNVNIVISNIGKALIDTFIVGLTRTFSNGLSETNNYTMYSSLYKDTIKIKLPIDKTKGAGNNKFDVYVDAMNQIQELNENNNQTSVNLFIRSNEIIPVYPFQYSIIPTDSITLKASTGDPFSGEQKFIFEIDTTINFNSSFKTNKLINHKGGVVEWELPFKLTQNQVYFWRVSKYYENPENMIWKTSSFIYIPEKTGWSQSTFSQIQNNDFNFIDKNVSEQKFEFITTPKKLHCHNVGSPYTDTHFRSIEYTIDGAGDYSACGAAQAIIVVVIDSLTLEPWESDHANYGHRDYPKCFSRSRTDKYFVFSTDIISLSKLAIMLEDSIPKGNYVLAYTFRNGNFENWGNDLYSAFENLGATYVRNLENNYPYIFFVKKGQKNTAQEVFGSSTIDVVDLYVDIETNFNYGDITSELIGPSKHWTSFFGDYYSLEENSQDSISLKIIGLDNSGNQKVLKKSISGKNIIELNDIDAAQYPFIKLNFFTQDNHLKTPAQINKWQIYYTQAPEIAINPSINNYFYKDTIQEGDNVIFSTTIENISDCNADSINVSYWLQDENNNSIILCDKKIDSLSANSYLIDTLKFSSLEHAGANSLWIEVNPINAETGNYYQIEQYHFNNIANKNFYVTTDETNPILDVTFDGRHIINQDLISAKPEIIIQLLDENKFIALNDTSLFAVYLKQANEVEEKRIYFSKNLIWEPAQLPDNGCKIYYYPDFTTDGEYQLRVQAKDKSSNESGDYDYQISFNVITKSTITNIFNYPNPFSTSTRFVFTLTGSEIPSDLRIQILTITGKLVKVINLAQVENIHIGQNITEYTWDGKDCYGDQLANGVYFYRVISSINGEQIEKRPSETNKFFTKQFGKMYLMR